MKQKIPVYIITAGFIISAVLFIFALKAKSGSYSEFILSELMLENSAIIFAECIAAAIVYNILRHKKFHRE